MAGVVHVKDGSTWKALNFGGQKIWVKHSSTWKEPTGVFVKHSGTWKKVYPSDLEAWTTSNRPTAASRQTTDNPPNLSSNPSYIYTNILNANGRVRWDDRASTASSFGQYIRVSDFNWSPASQAGFEYGAVTRVEVTVEAEYIDAPPSGGSFRIGVHPQGTSTYKQSANLTGTNEVYTFDFTPAEWGISNADAGALHLNDNYFEVSALYNNATAGFDQETEIEDFQARIKYKYNS